MIGIKLTVKVWYEPHGTPESDLQDALYNVIAGAANNGLLSGETEAEVETWSANVERMGASQEASP